MKFSPSLTSAAPMVSASWVFWRPQRKTYGLKLAPVMASEAAGPAMYTFLFCAAMPPTASATGELGTPSRISAPSFSIASRASVAPFSVLLAVSFSTTWTGRPAIVRVPSVT